ncbi:hypothetical protein Ciccas_000175 [Cichlidogyrus casuarinus]|uniref:Gelsolin-like domain-containing protein n=1 Tax=Cichlidogyrus casuarinus TaxID=1844966 RepID=A0ABD2QPS4_9PLAT
MPSEGLVRPKAYDWKDSNVALFGTDKDRQVKKESAQTETAWQGIDKITGDKLLVWRINAFHVEPVSEAEYGMFFGGDSYIVLKISKQRDGSLDYHVHFWIGSESTSDEYGTAAYKTVELDTFLDDKAIQHREVQDFESDLFLSYFKQVEILNGGYKSGFRHVALEEYQPRLLVFSIIGKGIPEVQEVQFSRRSLTSDDVFILDMGHTAVQWNGVKSSGRERIAAASYLQQLECERGGKTKCETIDEINIQDHSAFVETLPDKAIECGLGTAKTKDITKALFKLSDASGRLEFVCLSQVSAPRNMLNDNDVFIIEGSHGVYVYIGANCSITEKRNSLSHAHAYLSKTDHPFAPITVIGPGQKCQLLDALLE